jgi:hypothetical protein
VTVLIVLVGLVAVLAAAYAGRRHQTYAATYDPGNPDGNGAQAVARVLDGQGVDVEVVRSADALDRTAADSATTIVVTSTDRLGLTTTSRLLQHQSDAHLVVVAPGPQLVRELGLTTYPRVARPHDDVAAGCAEDRAEQLARGRLAVRAGDADEPGPRRQQAVAELDLGPDRDAALARDRHERALAGDARALHEHVDAVEQAQVELVAERAVDGDRLVAARAQPLDGCLP